MKYRSKPFTTRPMEILAFLVITAVVPIVLTYNILVVLPGIHATDSFLYKFTVFMDMILLFNVEANLWMCMCVDTNVDHEHADKLGGDENRRDWRHCKCCDHLVPPRSWHCKVCDVCILKRNHHCGFTGYCIGHLNYRYFMGFLFYLSALCIYNMVYNMCYIISHGILINHIKNLLTISKLSDLICLPITAAGLVFIGVFFPSALFVYHVMIVIRNETAYQDKKDTQYNLGAYNNLKCVFGERMYLAWMCPFIKSELPDDGYSLELKEDNEKIN